jgi:pimeloyl-ACP methyl ester carboxylesterase
MAALAPRDGGGLDWLAGMGQQNIEEFGAAVSGEPDLTRFLDQAAEVLRGITAAQLIAGMGSLLSAPDQAAVSDDFGEYLAASFRAALTTGIAGWRDDDLAFVGDWGFSLAAIGAGPAAIWQGMQDRMVPAGHGEWLAAHVPGARARLLPAEGHLTLGVTSYGRILDDLIEMAGLELPSEARSG